MTAVPVTPRIVAAILALIPATLLVIMGLGIAFLALFMGAARRRYAVQVVKQCVALAAVLTGVSTRPTPGR
jgi:hypothetical protein